VLLLRLLLAPLGTCSTPLWAEEIGATLGGALACLLLPPGGHRRVVAREEDLGNGRTTELCRSRVLRVLKEV
jgi:hypothetical protein